MSDYKIECDNCKKEINSNLIDMEICFYVQIALKIVKYILLIHFIKV